MQEVPLDFLYARVPAGEKRAVLLDHENTLLLLHLLSPHPPFLFVVATLIVF